MYIVGLTGGIASGKTTVLKIFESLGIEVFSADKIAKSLTEVNQPALVQIKNHFGENIVDENGHLNRALLRQKIFSNPKERLWLESILHPLIRKSLEEQVKASKTPYSVVEIPLLKNRDDYPYLDRVLVIVAEDSIQIERIRQRDKVNKDEALNVINSQLSNSERNLLADDLVLNNHDTEKLFKEIKNLHSSYLHLAAKKTL